MGSHGRCYVCTRIVTKSIGYNIPYKNPEDKRKQSNRYYHAHKEKCCAATKRWYDNNREYAIVAKQRWKLANPFRAKASALLHTANNRALKKGLECSLSLDLVAKMIENGCAISKLPFDLNSKGMSPYSPSIDRIDPTKGYTMDNIQVILQGINGLKLTGSNRDVYKIARAICDAMYVPE